MTTIQFWQGFMIGAAVNAALVLAFTMWQDRRDQQREQATATPPTKDTTP